MASVVNLLFGRRLRSSEGDEHKVGVFAGIPLVGLDSIGSCSYGPEAALLILSAAGLAGFPYLTPVFLAIVCLLAILATSYYQTIGTYPNAGGSYIVTKDNMGINAALFAAAALILDYILNVAVGISAGIGIIVSVFPGLHPYTLPLCIGTLLVITVVNLRGISEPGVAFAAPAYIFIISFFAILVIGTVKAVVSGGHPQAVVPPQQLGKPTEMLGLWLLLKCFSNGCTAMTGVEAVSNSITAFKEPRQKDARRTLISICVILGVFLCGIAYLCTVHKIGAMNQNAAGYRTVLAQLAAASVGQGVLYYVSMAAMYAVLALSANTSFADFPRLCQFIAKDGYLPKAFTFVGRRLVFNVGILFLSGVALLLLVIFKGILEALIPLFAVGAFLAFTFSQSGMVIHWYRRFNDKSRIVYVKFVINLVGALSTALALLIIVTSKFMAGAWLTLIFIPALVITFRRIKSDYENLERQVRKRSPISIKKDEPPVVVVLLSRWTRPADKALRFALRISDDVVAVHLDNPGGETDEQEKQLRAEWKEDVEEPCLKRGIPAPRLVVLQTPLRKFLTPLMEFFKKLEDEFPKRQVAVIMPELVRKHWWQYAFHRGRALRVKTALLAEGGPKIAIITIPWYLKQ